MKNEVEVIYGFYPRKAGKKNALASIAKALREKPFDDLLVAVTKYRDWCQRENIQEQFIPHPATWFNQGRYDDPLESHRNGGSNGKGDATMQALAECLAENSDGFGPNLLTEGGEAGQADIAALLATPGKRAN